MIKLLALFVAILMETAYADTPYGTYRLEATGTHRISVDSETLPSCGADGIATLKEYARITVSYHANSSTISVEQERWKKIVVGDVLFARKRVKTYLLTLRFSSRE